MNTILPALISLAGVVAVTAAILATLLVLRNPLRPHWLQGDAAAQWATLALVSAGALIIAHAINALVGAGQHLVAAIAMTVLTLFGSGFVIWRAFRFGERLARAEGGVSPFGHLPHRHAAKPAGLGPTADVH